MVGMSWWSRRRPPNEVVHRLSLDRGERPLAWATGDDGLWYVGTDRAVHLPESDGRYRKLPWEQVERADWRRDDDRLAIVEVADWGQPEPRTEVVVSEPGQLLELLRERVTRSVVCTLYAPVRGKAGLNVVGRRSPTGDGPVLWSFVLAPGLDPSDPAVLDVADRTLAQARAEVEGL